MQELNIADERDQNPRSLPGEPSPLWHLIVALVATSALIALVFWPALKYSPVSFEYWPPSWSPLHSLWRALPESHFVLNLITHIINACLVLLLARSLTGSIWRSALLATLFGCHVLQVESVVSPTATPLLVGACFALISFGTYVRHVKAPETTGGNVFYWGSVTTFAIAVTATPTVAPAALLLLLVDFFAPAFNRTAGGGDAEIARFDWLKSLRSKIPWLVIAAVSCALPLVFGRASGVANSSSIGERLVFPIVSSFSYLGKILWPASLAPVYPSLTIPWWEVIGALFVLAGLTLGFCALAHRRSPAASGWIVFLVLLVPAMLPVAPLHVADPHVYLAMLGVLIILVWGALGLLARLLRTQAAAAGIGVVLLGVMVVSAALQLRHWHDSEALLRHTVRVTDGNSAAHKLLGDVLAAKGDLDGAAVHYRQAIAIRPSDTNAAAAFNQVKSLHVITGAPLTLPKARDESGRAEAYLHSSAGLALAEQGRFAEAAAHFEQVVQQNPDDAEAQTKLGDALTKLGRNEEAMDHFSTALRLNPRDWLAHKGLALCLGRVGRVTEAVQHFLELVEIKPQDSESHYYLGLGLVIEGKREQAIPRFREAIRLNPYSDVALNDLAWILATHPDPKIRNGNEAVQMAELACRLANGREARYFGTLDAAYAEAERFDEAIVAAQKAAQLAAAVGDTALANAAKEREKGYWEGKPYRQP